MKKYAFILLIMFSPFSLADPFFGESTTKKMDNEAPITTEKTKKSAFFTACPLPEQLNKLNLPISFEDLQLVGLIKINQEHKALFRDSKNQLVELKENDFLENRLIQIKQINLKSLEYIDWELTEDCQHPYTILLKL